ncbi:MAG: hypothetical protein QOI68_2965, partial [Pseudonocardiales bacterium]|nr:hypothetical protein [Pseudonocardiales bacterium]
MSAGPEVARPRRVVLRATGSVRRRWRLAPLRIRLLLSTIGLLAAVCLVVGSISLLLLRGVLIDQLDQQLSVAAYRSVVLSKPPPDHGPTSSGNNSSNNSNGNNGNNGNNSNNSNNSNSNSNNNNNNNNNNSWWPASSFPLRQPMLVHFSSLLFSSLLFSSLLFSSLLFSSLLFSSLLFSSLLFSY